MTTSMIAGAVAAAVAVGLLGLLAPQPRCPRCDTSLPRVRLPRTRAQALHGGWTCPSCGCELDRKGRAR